VAGDGPGSAPAHRSGRGPSGETWFQRAERIADAYGLVLVLILSTFVVTVTLPPEGWAGRVAAIAVAGLTALVALTSSDVPLERVRLAALAAIVATLAAIVGKFVSSSGVLGVGFIIVSVLLAIAAYTILRRVVGAAHVDFRMILGAISVYTLLGLLFGNLFLALGELKGSVFTGVQQADAADYMFFSYTTLTTTGYGNLIPSGDVGQILAVLEMLAGQIFLVTLVARLVSLWRPGARPAQAGQSPGEPPS
jgi:hypothetical protein